MHFSSHPRAPQAPPRGDYDGCGKLCTDSSYSILSESKEVSSYTLRHYATNRNVAGSIPDGVIGINSLT
jgi:hypothetical protein